MTRWIWAGLALLIILPGWAQPDGASPPPPRAYSGGDYWVRCENTWLDWEVTSAQLNGHLTPVWPSNDEEPGALLNIDWQMQRWPVVARFTKGERLKARPDSVGGIMWKDLDGSSWMRVVLPDGQSCFVRANSRFVKPIKVETAAAATGLPQMTSPEPEK